MLADKTLLSVTLAATFATGLFVGGALRSRPRAGAPPIDAQTIYAPQLAAFEAKGYDAAEMDEARSAYTEYLDRYQGWWNEFLDLHRDNLDIADRGLEQRLAALAQAHAARKGEAGPR
jgi:hypothetical protein